MSIMKKTNLHLINEKKYQQTKDKSAHGISLLPLAKYHTKISEMLPFYPIHWHEEMEIVKVQSGKGIFWIDGKKYQANAGDIIILRPFVMHSINSLDDNDMEIDATVFNLRLLESDTAAVGIVQYFAPLLNERQSIPCIVRPIDSWHRQFDDNLTCILTRDDCVEGAELDTKSNLYQMFNHIYSNRLLNVSPNIAEDKLSYTIRLALEYILAEYANEITIENVAKHCNYSEFYLMKLFKQYTGLSCVDYANNYRLTVAGRQLRDTDSDISTIARNVGFNNISYFNRQFKKLYGTTPKEFRTQQI